MNKILVYILFFFSLTVFGQADTLVAEPPTAEKMEIYIDEDSIASRSFRENFQKDYTSEDFIYETIAPKETTKWDNFKAWLLHWLDRIFSFGGEGNATAFEIILKTLALLVVLFVVYLIVKAIINKEGGWIFGKSSKKKIKIAEFQEEDIHNIDFKSIIEKNKSLKNYRLSIRYYYLWLLKRMSDSHIIEWDIEKTNSDYLYEIQRAALKEDFQYLSYIYDYSWYGEFTIDEALFQKAEKAFIKTINSV